MLASSKLLWFRLHQGKVWHVAASGATVALCGQTVPTRGERQPKRPPFGGRPCPDCSSVSAQVEHNIEKAEEAVAEQRRTPVPPDEVAPDPYDHDLTGSAALSDEEFAYRAGSVLTVEEILRSEDLIEGEPGTAETVARIQAAVATLYGVFGETAPAEYGPADDPEDL